MNDFVARAVPNRHNTSQALFRWVAVAGMGIAGCLSQWGRWLADLPPLPRIAGNGGRSFGAGRLHKGTFLPLRRSRRRATEQKRGRLEIRGGNAHVAHLLCPELPVALQWCSHATALLAPRPQEVRRSGNGRVGVLRERGKSTPQLLYLCRIVTMAVMAAILFAQRIELMQRHR